MYLTATYPIQFPEVTDTIKRYFNDVYDHDYITQNKEEMVKSFIRSFPEWFNKGKFKVKGLKNFPYVYITNGITEAIHVTMLEHGLRPVVADKEYKSYLAHARIYAESGNTLRKRTPFLSLPFYDTAEEHPTTQTILKGPAFIDLAWAGNCGLQGTYDLSNVSYASFSFSKMFGIQYHRIGILYSKTPIKHFEMYKDVSYNNLVGLGMINQLTGFKPDYFYDKYRHVADSFCTKLDLQPTKSLWMGRSKKDTKVPLFYEWLEWKNENGK